jgi:hypothetical protein
MKTKIKFVFLDIVEKAVLSIGVPILIGSFIVYFIREYLHKKMPKIFSEPKMPLDGLRFY